MTQVLEKRLETLRKTIEDLRKELHITIVQNDGKFNSAETYDISERLDELVAEYLRLKERLIVHTSLTIMSNYNRILLNKEAG